MNAIVAVVIDGVLLTDGYGAAIGIVFGTLTLAIVNQGIFYTDLVSLILGILLLVAVLNNIFRRLALPAPSTASQSQKETQTMSASLLKVTNICREEITDMMAELAAYCHAIQND